MKRPLFRFSPLALLSAYLAFAAPSLATELSFERCQIKLGAVQKDAECATLLRPENPDQPDGKKIELKVAKFPSDNPNPAADALTLIQGGPGASSIDMGISFAPIIELMLAKRDVLLVDQRGTGRSNKLECPIPEEGLELVVFDPVIAEKYARECAATLKDSDLRFYTTSVAVQDLEAVRAAAGYEQLTVYGVSYGTRVAQHYLRRFPERNRAVILDGVTQVGLNLAGGEIARRSQDALDGVFNRCKSEAACSDRFGDLEMKFKALTTRLKDTPVEVTMPDPRSGKKTSKVISELHLFGVVRMLAYGTEGLALLPLIIDSAYQGDYVPLVAQTLMVEESMTSMLAAGMHNSVVCTEDYPYVTEQDKRDVEGTYFGNATTESFDISCGIWPRGYIDDDFLEPFDSDVPVLILSGETDPITPPSNGEKAAQMLSNSKHFVVPGHGHGVIGRGCVPALIEDFVINPDLSALKPDCIERERPMPFFVDSTGPRP